MAFADDYIDVAERIRVFKEKYPDGTLQSFMPPWVENVGGKSFIVYSAAAFRTPDDSRPGVGWAWEPVPGPTPYTRDSELQNAETSAWGRAIVALGFETKKIASAEEVRNRSANHEPQQKYTPDHRNTPAAQQSAPCSNGDDPGQAVVWFGKNQNEKFKGKTVATIFDMPPDAQNKGGGPDYLQWIGFKLDADTDKMKDLQVAVKEFLQQKLNAYEASVSGDPGPSEPWVGNPVDDDIPFAPRFA